MLADGARRIEMRRVDLGPAVARRRAEKRGAANVPDLARLLAGREAMRDLDDLPLTVAEYEQVGASVE